MIENRKGTREVESLKSLPSAKLFQLFTVQTVAPGATDFKKVIEDITAKDLGEDDDGRTWSTQF